MVPCTMLMRDLTRFRTVALPVLLIGLACAGTTHAQDSPESKPPDEPVIAQEQAVKNPTAPCLQPPPMVRLQDYDGPYRKTIGLFTKQVERKTVHPVHYKVGDVLCSLELKDKFLLFVRGSYDPIAFLTAGFNAGI